MSTAERPAAIDPGVMAELQEAAELAAKGVRDPERMRLACEEMDRTRERIRDRIGVVDFAVPTIRELRDA